MRYRVYLLDISQWLEKVNRESTGLILAEDSAVQALGLIPRERAEKVVRAKTSLGQAHSLGAGLLLQYVWKLGREAYPEEQIHNPLCPISVETILGNLQGTQQSDIPMTYGSKGKPYFANERLYFSLSHSGDYVLCVVSGEEIGADIQQCKPGIKESLVKRVLNETELEEWQALRQEDAVKDSDCGAENSQAALRYFYRKWTEKEAYGKLTGEGVFELLGQEKVPVAVACTENFRDVPGYCISVCQYDK